MSEPNLMDKCKCYFIGRKEFKKCRYLMADGVHCWMLLVEKSYEDEETHE